MIIKKGPYWLEWDDDKDEENQKDHGISFFEASAVYDDPNFFMFPNYRRGEDRWCTVGMIGTEFYSVFHLYDQANDQEFFRIISARDAEPNEIRRYYRRNRPKPEPDA
jgi:uncharacterized protein